MCERYSLTESNVSEVYRNCCYRPEELELGKVPKDAIKVEGIEGFFFFHPERLKKNEKKISDMLLQLPEEFREGESYFWFSYKSKDWDAAWTNKSEMAEELLALGLAIGMARFAIPKQWWWVVGRDSPMIIV